MKNLSALVYRALFSRNPRDAVESLLSKSKHPQKVASVVFEMMITGHRGVLGDAFVSVQNSLDRGLRIHSLGNDSWLQIDNESEINQVIETCLRHGADIDYINSQSCTLLSAALSYGKNEVIGYLIGKGASLNSVQRADRKSYSPMVFAAKRATYQEQDIWMSDFLDRGADIEGRDSEGQTALWIVALTGPLGWADALVKKGANPMSLNDNGDTMLHYMLLEHGEVFMNSALWMIKNGVDPEHRNNQKKTVYDLIAKYYGQEDGKEVRANLGKALAERQADLLDKASPSAPVVHAKSMRL